MTILISHQPTQSPKSGLLMPAPTVAFPMLIVLSNVVTKAAANGFAITEVKMV